MGIVVGINTICSIFFALVFFPAALSIGVDPEDRDEGRGDAMQTGESLRAKMSERGAKRRAVMSHHH